MELSIFGIGLPGNLKGCHENYSYMYHKLLLHGAFPFSVQQCIFFCRFAEGDPAGEGLCQVSFNEGENTCRRWWQALNCNWLS
jgi:hypothetical protein